MNESDDIFEIKDLNHFVKLLSNWHTNKVNLVKHLLDTPENVEVIINEAEPRKLTEDFRKGFQLGITLALAELGNLPFVAELEDTETATKH